MKKSFSTVACMNATVEMIVDACEKYSIDGVEIRMTAFWIEKVWMLLQRQEGNLKLRELR